ncbi:MAG: hypothetical protein Faunusvirus21_1, partial [Faunusvirus sp.]
IVDNKRSKEYDKYLLSIKNSKNLAVFTEILSAMGFKLVKDAWLKTVE